MKAENPIFNEKRWYRMYRGGGWFYLAKDARSNLSRRLSGTSSRDDYLGFRLVRNK